MHVISIVPVKNLHLIEDKLYHLCLLQECKKSDEYVAFYKDQVKQGHYVILDNGVAESLKPNMDEIVYFQDKIGAQEIVLPDVFFEADYTVKAVAKAYEHPFMVFNELEEYPLKTMAVAQGRNLDEWLRCAMQLIQFPITCLGAPKNLVHSMGDYGREYAIERLLCSLLRQNRKIEIHLLGCWKDPREIGLLYSDYGHAIRSVDSTIAALYAQEGLLLDIEKYPKPGDNRTFLRFDNEDMDEGLLDENIKRWEAYSYGTLQ